ncbi:hypothetical protein MHU86_17576 [Fragilaria crotonensis]|nr:hypothetical protein MHU86_17576 [Fragilaria crotonensis]
MSSARHPIVVFIDNIQWMDEGSRQLIEALLKDNELCNVMLIFSYRDDDDDDEIVGDLFEGVKDIIDIPLSNLDTGSVRQLVSALLESSTGQIGELCDVVALRSMGNPFHVIQFIEIIQKERLLWYDERTSSWIFDMEAIEREMTESETLVQLVSRRIGLLDVALQEVLKIASLLGSCFKETHLTQIISAAIKKNRFVGEPPRIPQSDVYKGTCFHLDGCGDKRRFRQEDQRWISICSRQAACLLSILDTSL